MCGPCHAPWAAGGTRFIGVYLARKLVEAGHEVRACVCARVLSVCARWEGRFGRQQRGALCCGARGASSSSSTHSTV